MAEPLPNGHCGADGPSPPPFDHKRSYSASATDSTPRAQTEPSTPKSKSLPPLLPPNELYSHLRDTTTEIAPHPAALSPLLRSSSFRRRLSTPPHLSPVHSVHSARSRPPSPLATKTPGGSGGYFDLVPQSGADTPLLDREREGQGRRGSACSDALMTPAEERQFSTPGSESAASTPRSLSQRGSEDQLPRVPEPEPGSKLSGGDSPASGTLERRARRRQVVRLDSFGGEGLARKPSARRLSAAAPGPEPVPGGTTAPPPTPMPESR